MDGCSKLWSIVCLGGVVAVGALAPVSLADTGDRIASTSASSVEAIAQVPRQPTGYTVLHVNATSGHDAQGDGSQLRPYRTITHALSLAETNTLILLADGLYSADSGETFPLRLRSGVTVQGLAGPNTASVVIQGSSNYRSATSGLRQITVLGADNAGLANVTISNPHPEGTGLWIESGSPIVLDSAFFRNGANGIYVAGQGTPVIRGNYFGENGQAGLVIAGPSTAKVEANVFENTGAGITVAPESSPEIVNNQISGNLDGLIVHAAARPTLQGNDIVRNRRNSIVDYATWSSVPPTNPRPGATQPPPPVATPQTQTSAPATATAAVTPPPSVPEVAPAASPPVPASEAIAAPSTAAAAVPELAAAEPATIATPPETATPAVTEPPAIAYNALADETLGDFLGRGIDHTAIALNQIDLRVVPAIPSEATLAGLDLVPVVETVESLAIARAPESPPEETPTETPTETPAETPAAAATDADVFSALPSPGTAERPDELLSADGSPLPEAIEIPIIPPPAAAIAKPAIATSATNLPTAIEAGANLPEVPAVPDQPTSTAPTARLAVPNASIPLGSGGSLPEELTAALPTGEGPPPPPSLAASLGLNYKVLVAASNPDVQAEVQAQVPDAFRTRLNGQLYIQAGAYPTLAEAQVMRNQLRQVGLPAQIEEVR